MSAAYHERFAAALAAALPEGFTVHADHSLIAAQHSAGGCLTGFTPNPADKRGPIDPADVARWIDSATANIRRHMYHYTPAAKEEGRVMLDALGARRPAP